MRNYWGKIALGALLIFAVGYALVSAGRRVKSSIGSGKSITIPLGSFVPFKLNDLKVGSIRSLTIRRASPHVLAGFDLRVRLSDSAAFARLEDCRLSVNDANNFDERTSFFCLPSDSGYQAFGQVSATLEGAGDTRVLSLPLLLPDDAVRKFQRQGGPETGPGLADSIAAEVTGRVRPLSRAYRDSIRAAELDRQSERYKARADSIRARSIQPAPATPATPANPPKPL